jgi:ABC-type nitrate/sulfonate/bicarbonate transport system ATPase subunit
VVEIECRHIGKRFQTNRGCVEPLKDVTLTLPAGQITALIGESGCGKTTLLRIIAGLEQAGSGKLLMTPAQDTEGRAPRVAVVFQEPRLFAWMSVYQNIEIAVRDLPPDERRSRVEKILALVGLTQAAQAFPSELSGGMAQRVGLARALVLEPDVLLLDEAFSALDALTRMRLYKEFIRIHETRPMTVLLITHDVTEAVLLSKQVYKLCQGRVASHFSVPFDYPRSLSTPGVSDMSDLILKEFL